MAIDKPTESAQAIISFLKDPIAETQDNISSIEISVSDDDVIDYPLWIFLVHAF